jgi:hypothetical protein
MTTRFDPKQLSRLVGLIFILPFLASYAADRFMPGLAAFCFALTMFLLSGRDGIFRSLCASAPVPSILRQYNVSEWDTVLVRWNKEGVLIKFAPFCRRHLFPLSNFSPNARRVDGASIGQSISVTGLGNGRGRKT